MIIVFEKTNITILMSFENCSYYLNLLFFVFSVFFKTIKGNQTYFFRIKNSFQKHELKILIFSKIFIFNFLKLFYVLL